MPPIIIATIISYLIGSVPTAYIIVRLVKGLDIRKFGSGNVGATNTFRILGRAWGALVLAIDICKGIIPVTLLANYFISKDTIVSANFLRVALGIACVCGHNWTVFLRFKGGKGVATSFGVLIGLAIGVPGIKIIFALTLLTWTLILLIFRMVSLASMVSGIALPLYMVIYRQPKELIVMSIVFCLFILWRHKPNIARLLRGEEKKSNYSHALNPPNISKSK